MTGNLNFNFADLNPDVVTLGLLTGLLTGTPADPAPNLSAWFSDPLTNLEDIPDRLQYLVGFIDSMIGSPEKAGPPVFHEAQWYSLPIPCQSRSLTHIVTSKPEATSGEIGFGLLSEAAVGAVILEVFLYVPVFTYNEKGVQPVIPDKPCQLGFCSKVADESQPFTVGDVTFIEMCIDASIYLSDKSPKFQLSFENLKGSSDPDKYSKLPLDDPTAPVFGWMNEVFAQSSGWLNTYVSPKFIDDTDDKHPYGWTTGELLEAADFLTTTPPGGAGGGTSPDDVIGYPPYYLNVAGFQGLDPLHVVFKLAQSIVDAMANVQYSLIQLPGNGGIYLTYRESESGQKKHYGLRIATSLDLDIGFSKTPPVTSSKTLTLSLGDWLTGETDDDNWLKNVTGSSSPRGLSIYFLEDDAGHLCFKFGFSAVSCGATIKGNGDANLIEAKGYKLKGAELRGYLEYDTQLGEWGLAARLDDVGFPLGPDFSKSSGNNGVAKSLVASSSGDDTAQANQKEVVNPTFSLTAAYVMGNDPLLEIFDATGAPTDIIWYPVQRRFGPINAKKIGLKIQDTGDHRDDPVMGMVFDGGVMLGGLDVELDQFSINAPLKEITDPNGYFFDLQGMAITYNGGGVEISGGLVKDERNELVSYQGEALIKSENLSIAALGEFSEVKGGGAAMFIFGWLDTPLGGPACFYVTGLSAGFGYNYKLAIPAQDQVQSMPLVAGLTNPNLLGGDGATPPSPGQALATLDEWVQVEKGEYWVAAGVQFTTYEIINTNALAVVEFGKDTVISLLGLSTLKQPIEGNPLIYAELDIEVIIAVAEGAFKASAVLSPNSYVLNPDAHLTGGFAFYAWWGSNEHAGDFVFTMGGYHPAFKPPKHYPQEDRLGINWKINDQIYAEGGAYFAITPTAAMAGIAIQFVFQAGPLKAWYKAMADAILFYRPFYLMASIRVSIGVSIRIHILFVDTTFSVTLGVDLDLFGPPMGFRAHIDWYIISFTISFRTPEKIPGDLNWEQHKNMLPSKSTQSKSTQNNNAPSTLSMEADDGPTTKPAYLHINSVSGLLRTHHDKTTDIHGKTSDITYWLVRAHGFSVSLTSALPATEITVLGTDQEDNKTFSNPNSVGMRRVNGGIKPEDYQSAQQIAVLELPDEHNPSDITACIASDEHLQVKPDDCNASLHSMAGWDIEEVKQTVPKSLYSNKAGTTAGNNPADGGQVDINPADGPTVVALVGLTMTPKAPVLNNCTPEMVITTVFGDLVINPDDEKHLPLSQAAVPVKLIPAVADSFQDIANINSDPLVKQRTDVFTELMSMGVNGWVNDPLPEMARSPGKAFADEPLAGSPVAVHN